MFAKLLRLGAILAAPLALAGTASAQQDPSTEPAGLLLFSGEGYQGDLREVFEPVYTLNDFYFNDQARSVAVLSGAWELCEHANFTGRCVFIRDDVPDLGWYGLDYELTSARPVYEYTEAEHGLMFVRDETGYIRYADNARYGYDDYAYGYGASTRISIYHYGYSPTYRSYGYYDPGLGYGPYGFGWTRHGVNTHYGHEGYRRKYYRERPPLRGHYGARNGAVTLYTDSNGRGASLGLNRGIADLSRYRFNDNISSVDINSGTWELCEHANYGGRCQIVDASVNRLNGLRLNDNISSIRPVGDSNHAGRPGKGRRDTGGRDRGDRDHHDRKNWDGRRGQGVDGINTPAMTQRRGGGDGLAGGRRVQPAVVTPPAIREVAPPQGDRMNRNGDRQRRGVRTGNQPRDTGQVRRNPANVQSPAALNQRPNRQVTKPAVVQRQTEQDRELRRERQIQRPQVQRQLPQTPAMRNRQNVQRAQPQTRAEPQRQRQQVRSQPAPVQRAQPRQARPQRQAQPQPRPQPAARPAPPPQPAPQRAQPKRDTRPPAMRKRVGRDRDE